ncbi:YhbD family protein [Paenibacillus polygoni]|uniref:YhbD family protein n=1 Tax=Paenibacillus polygoni TaxID=3050112 RepID=A0ABY8X0E8_9BACL|nr:YhbD family protein [Paenibacillus polygoni]WIV18875.1 YhbD family protein [Paenibacillus polygoni]
MTEDLISKKELLEQTGISYGQLYRWKRKNLIPEDWFIRKSSFTGQETFFPRESILTRIDRIKNMKDELSLDELADVFSPSVSNKVLTRVEIERKHLVTPISIHLFLESGSEKEKQTFSFEEMLCIYVLDQALASGQMNREEGILLVQTFQAYYSKFQDKGCDIILTRKMGIPLFTMLTTGSEVYFDTGVKEVLRLSLNTYLEQLKVKLSESEGF